MWEVAASWSRQPGASEYKFTMLAPVSDVSDPRHFQALACKRTRAEAERRKEILITDLFHLASYH